jgi:hypothetical protein
LFLLHEGLLGSGSSTLPGQLTGHRVQTTGGNKVNPHVIVQFSWAKNDLHEQACATDEMMKYAGTGKYSGLFRPNVAYLIKALCCGKGTDAPVYGFDIFLVQQDRVTGDEPASTKFSCGENEDVKIKIIAAEMSLEENDG